MERRIPLHTPSSSNTSGILQHEMKCTLFLLILFKTNFQPVDSNKLEIPTVDSLLETDPMTAVHSHKTSFAPPITPLHTPLSLRM
jgi:hypothetical protein